MRRAVTALLLLIGTGMTLVWFSGSRGPSVPVDVVPDVAPAAAEPAPAEVALRRSELVVSERGERVLRAPDGPGIQGWLTVEGGERPRWLTARGEGLELGQRIEVAEDGHFAIADAVAGARYLLMLPEGLVTSDAPSADSVVGSRYVHLAAPARVDVYAQTLATTLRLRLALPDDLGAASGMRALCTLDGRDARTFLAATDDDGWLIVPLPSDGWWTNLAVDPRLHDDVLYDPVYVSRVDVPASGVLGALLLNRARIARFLFLGPTDLPVAGVRAEEPVSCAPSDADGRLAMRMREADGASWMHETMVRSTANWPDRRDGPERIVRLVPQGSWRLIAATSDLGEELELRRIPGAFGSGRHLSRRGPTLRTEFVHGFGQWTIENRAIGPDDGLLVAWRGIPVRLEPLGFARSEGEPRAIAAPELTRFEVEVLRPDGSPAADATVHCARQLLAHADESGLLVFDLPAALDRQSLSFAGDSTTVPIAFEFDAQRLPAVPRILQFERAEQLRLEISVSQGELPRSIEVATEGEQGTTTVTLRQRGGLATGGRFPAGPRWYRISAEGFESRSLRHDAASAEPLRVTLEARAD